MKKPKSELGEATLARVKKEMARPRMAKSAREGGVNPVAGRMVPLKREKAKLQVHPLALLRRAR
jgi:hypothetical protein